AGAGGPAFRTSANFQAILRWNQSDFFGLAVGLLSDKIAPGPGKRDSLLGALKIMYDGAVMPLAIVNPRSAPLTFVQVGAVLLLAASLAACGSSGSKNVVQRGSYKVGAPYKIDGVTYTPTEEFNPVETGVPPGDGAG